MSYNAKIKIAFVINNLNVGGAEKLLVDQLKYFDREKFDLSLITLLKYNEKDNFYNLVPEDVATYKLNFTNFYDFKSWFGFYRLMKKIRPDVVRSSLFFSNTVVGCMKIFFGYQIIAALHNTHIDKSKKHILVDKIMSKIFYKIITDSQQIIDFTTNQEKIPVDKFKVIYNGIDLSDIRLFQSHNSHDSNLELRKELGIAPDDKVILNIGRIVKQKNHKLLLESFRNFCDKQEGFKLIIVGDGSGLDTLRSYVIDLGLKEKVIFTGLRKDLYKFYNISDFFVLTSIIEGFSLVTVMALAFGLPVVSTKVAGVVEYIKDGYNGFLADSNANDIADKMIVISNLSDANLKAYKMNCKETADKFDIQTNVKKYESIFMESLKNY